MSPGRTLPMSRMPKKAVIPGMPRAPMKWVTGARSGSMATRAAESASAYSCTPNSPLTQLPSGWDGFREATTRPTAGARITSPRATGEM